METSFIPVGDKKLPRTACPICKTTKDRQSGVCRACYDRMRKNENRLPQDELLQIITENNGNFSKVGRLLGFTGNAIRKWCKSYGMPTSAFAYHRK